MAPPGHEATLPAPPPPPPPPPTLPRTPPSLLELSRLSMREILAQYVEHINIAAPPQQPEPRMVSVHVNFLNRRITVTDENDEVERRERTTKGGWLPALNAAVEAMPLVVVVEKGFECSICLKEVGNLAKKMPCGHMYHSGCIEKWLGMHGVCPICRFEMPMEEGRENGGEDDEMNWDGQVENGGDSFENGVVFNYVVDGSTGEVYGANWDVHIHGSDDEWSVDEYMDC